MASWSFLSVLMIAGDSCVETMVLRHLMIALYGDSSTSKVKSRLVPKRMSRG